MLMLGVDVAIKTNVFCPSGKHYCERRRWRSVWMDPLRLDSLLGVQFKFEFKLFHKPLKITDIDESNDQSKNKKRKHKNEIHQQSVIRGHPP